MVVFCSKAPSRGAYGGGEGDQRDDGGDVELPVSRLSSYFKIWNPNGTISKIKDFFVFCKFGDWDDTMPQV
jgi:hypothetical protein